ncbi:MAG: GGDEF domain-containing protein [Atopobiaceae bacterium]|nr:GGDEF domain-containing protein [Atopobiaceae bacterium]
MALSQRIKRFLGLDELSPYFIAYMQRTNANLAVYAGVAVACIELLLLVNTMLHKGMYDAVTNRLNRTHGITQIAFIVVSLLLTWKAQRATKQGRTSEVELPVAAYIVFAMSYGVFNSWIDALYGEPPLTFIFCSVACTCVFVMPPVGSLLVNSIAFTVFFLLSNFSATFSGNTVFHYWVGWIIVCFVSMLRYQECRNGATHEQRLHDASELDELTGLRNRRSLRGDYPKLVNRDLFVVMCDIDNFKGVNDTYGHVEGDHVLKAFGRGIESAFGHDNCYRYGGDEFLIISHSCKSLAEFRQRVALMRINFATNMRAECKIEALPTSSVGYCSGFAKSEDDLRAMMHIADSNLYDVKRSTKGGTRGEEFQAISS